MPQGTARTGPATPCIRLGAAVVPALSAVFAVARLRSAARSVAVRAAFLSVALFAIASCDQEPAIGKGWPVKQGFLTPGRTTSTEPVDLELVDARGGPSLKLRVPKAYLTDQTTWGGGRVERIQIETSGLPNLEPGPAYKWPTAQ